MAHYWITRTTEGRIVDFMQTANEREFEPQEGRVTVEVTQEEYMQVAGGPAYFSGSGIVAIPPQPSKHHEFHYPTKSWQDGRSAVTKLADVQHYIRETRDRLLQASDWTQVIDVPMESGLRAAWAVYRQELRDMPSVYSQALAENLVSWPSPP